MPFDKFRDKLASLGLSPRSVREINDKVGGPREDVVVRKPPAIAEDIEVIEEYEIIEKLIGYGAPLIFATGGAGTGKSTLIKYLKRKFYNEMVAVAPTGVAALNVNGVTIHSFFRFPPKIIEDKDIERLFDRELIHKLKLLVVDEVSMVNPNVLDSMDKFLRKNKKSGAPFGGVSLLLVGDLFQLPPVTTKDELLCLNELGYKTNMFFSAKSIREYDLIPVFLDRVFRQSDIEFIKLLNNIREDIDTNSMIACLNSGHLGTVAQPNETILTGDNATADSRNSHELEALPGEEKIYVGHIEGKWKTSDEKLPSPMQLRVKVGAQVMFTSNDPSKRWVNGSVGFVTEMRDDGVVVALPASGGGQKELHVTVKSVSWEKYEYKLFEGGIRTIVSGTYSQIPLMLAWAITIHKSQGKTLGNILVDLKRGAFASGQLYVALSRVTSIKSLRFPQPLKSSDVIVSPEAIEFYRIIRGATVDMERAKDNFEANRESMKDMIVDEHHSKQPSEQDSDKCPLCGSTLEYRSGVTRQGKKYGPLLGCKSFATRRCQYIKRT